jgi:hypothetical protein
VTTKYLITNTWTQAKHGHARDELITIKNFLTSSSIEASILSVDSEFGDFPIRSVGRSLQRLHFDRSRALKPFVDYCYGKDLSRGIRKANARAWSPGIRVAITSSRFNHVTKLENSLQLEDKLRIRMLDAPSKEKDWIHLANCLKRMSKESVVAMEVKSSVIESQKYFDNVIHVPSHYGMQTEDAYVNSARDKVGVFWPVGRSFQFNEVITLIDEVKTLEPIVKLPSGFNTSVFKKLYPRIEFLETGLKEKEFRDILSSVKVAVLGHVNYENQSSGYSGYFLANNIPMFVSATNSFFGEIKNQGQVYALEAVKDSVFDLISKLMDRELSLDKNPYADFVEKSWKRFLFD